MSIVAQAHSELPPLPASLRRCPPLPAPTLIVGRIRIHEPACSFDHVVVQVNARDARAPESSGTLAHYESWLSVWLSIPDLAAFHDRKFDLILEAARWDTMQEARVALDYVPRIVMRDLSLGQVAGYVMRFLNRVPQ
jgi:hypothetical protein